MRIAGRAASQIHIKDESPGPGDAPHIKVEFEFAGEPSATVWLRHSSQAGCPDPLAQIFRQIERSGRYVPMMETCVGPHSVTIRVMTDTTMILPQFTIGDLKSAAVSDRLFPPDIIRVTPQCRVLNIDLPVSALASDISHDEKEAFLRELIVLREQSRKTTFYEGQVFLLNR